MPLPYVAEDQTGYIQGRTGSKKTTKTLCLDQLKDRGDDGALQDREPVVFRVVRVYVCSCLQPTDWVDPLWELAPLFLGLQLALAHIRGIRSTGSRIRRRSRD
jgi:hypothetical protein